MADENAPNKSTVRRFIVQRVLEHEPPPSPEEIRRRLGWDMMIEVARNEAKKVLKP